MYQHELVPYWLEDGISMDPFQEMNTRNSLFVLIFVNDM